MAGALFGATLTAWILSLLVSASAKGPAPGPGPATLTTGPEGPAVVDLLVNRGKRTRTGLGAALAAAVGMVDSLVASGSGRTRVAPTATLLDRPLAAIFTPPPSRPGRCCLVSEALDVWSIVDNRFSGHVVRVRVHAAGPAAAVRALGRGWLRDR